MQYTYGDCYIRGIVVVLIIDIGFDDAFGVEFKWVHSSVTETIVQLCFLLRNRFL